MHIEDSEKRARLLKRLRRIEGQVRGIQRMLEEERDCTEVVQQVAAIRSAMQSVGVEVMRTYATQCLRDPDSAMSDEDVIDYMLKVLS